MLLKNSSVWSGITVSGAESGPRPGPVLPQHHEVADGFAHLHACLCRSRRRHQHQVPRDWPAAAAQAHPAGGPLSRVFSLIHLVSCSEDSKWHLP